MIDWPDLVRPRCVTSGWQLAGLVTGNLGIAAVYLRIPIVLRRIVRRLGGHVLEGRIVRKAARFVQACGLTHLFGVAALFFVEFDAAALIILFYACFVSLAFERVVSAAEEDIVRTVLEARELQAVIEGVG